ncbi:MAG: hypothetical protein DMF58_20145, partial [Acidobacteria bacterium]
MSSATTGSPTSVPAPIAVPPSGRSMASRPYAGFGECAISECIQTYNFPFCPFGTNFPARGISIINDRRQFLGTAAMSVVAARSGVLGSLGKRMARTALQLFTEGELPSFAGANGWLNSQPLTPAGLRGKVVLVDFWTYTCINWLRTLPHIRAWSEKYKNHGLVVIGVHTPEFPFEHNVDNVRRAAKDMRVDYPIAIDSDYAIWRAFNNEYWPALYFVDAQGRIRHHEFGEGNYEQSEMIIQALLRDAGVKD